MQTRDHEEQNYKNIIFKIILLFIMCNAIVSVALYYFHVNAQKEDLFTEISNKSRAVGMSIANLIERETALGMPLNELREGSEYLNKKLKTVEELGYLVVTDRKGDIIAKTDGVKDALKGSFKRFAKTSHNPEEDLPSFNAYSYSNVPLFITDYDKNKGYLHVGISNKAVADNISGVFYDIAVILIASLVIGYEFLSYIFMNSIVYPMRELVSSMKRVAQADFSSIDQARTKDNFGKTLFQLNNISLMMINWFDSLKTRAKKIDPKSHYYEIIHDSLKDIGSKFRWPEKDLVINPLAPIVNNLRLVAFLMVFAEAIVVPLQPSYASQFYDPNFSVSKQFISSLPVILFMVFSGISVPLASKLVAHLDFRRTFIVGFLLSIVGYLIVFFHESLWSLLISRSITALGFGIGYVCCQNYVADYAKEGVRTESYAIYSLAVGSAYMCGAPIGGVLVDNIGYQYTFFLSVIVSLLAISIAGKYIVDFKASGEPERKQEKIKSSWKIFSVSELSFVVIFSGFPIRLMYSSLICFIYPLYLQNLGNNQATIGRVMMIFGFVWFIISNLAPKMVGRVKSPELVAVFSSFTIAIPMVLDHYFRTTFGVVVGLVVFTAGTVIHISAVMTILDNIATRVQKTYSKRSVLGFYFVSERIGMIFGPAVAVFILSKADFGNTLFYLGIALVISNIIYWLFIALRKTEIIEPEQELNQLKTTQGIRP